MVKIAHEGDESLLTNAARTDKEQLEKICDGYTRADGKFVRSQIDSEPHLTDRDRAILRDWFKYVRNVKKPDINDRNIEIHLTYGRQLNMVRSVLDIARHFNVAHPKRSFYKIYDGGPDAEATAIDLNSWMEGRAWTLDTRNERKGLLKRLGKTIYRNQSKSGYPLALDNIIKKKKSGHYSVDHADLFTFEQVCKIANSCTYSRDAALVMLAFTGARPGDVHNACIGDFFTPARTDEESQDLRLRVDGKLGKRVIAIGEAEPYVRNWIDELSAQCKEAGTDPNSAFLACHVMKGLVSKHGPGVQITSTGFTKIFKDAIKRAEGADLVPPRPNPKKRGRNTAAVFRKSFASDRAQSPGVNQYKLEKLMGWKPGSSIARAYIGMDREGDDTAAITADLLGKKELEIPVPIFDSRVKTCDNCGENTLGMFVECIRCNEPWSTAAPLNEVVEAMNHEVQIAKQRNDAGRYEIMADGGNPHRTLDMF